MSNITQKWVGLLTPFSRNYAEKITASELAKKTDIPQQTTSRYLNNLVKNNLIEYKKQGKNKLFYFDLKKQTSKIIFNLIENQKTLQFQIKNNKISVIINELLTFSKNIILFGSYASGEQHKKSDLDIIILEKCDKKQINKIRKKYVIEINIQYTTLKDFKKSLQLKNALANEVLQKHIFFGNISNIIEILFEVET